jgi:hypothetical protein
MEGEARKRTGRKGKKCIAKKKICKTKGKKRNEWEKGKQWEEGK